MGAKKGRVEKAMRPLCPLQRGEGCRRPFVGEEAPIAISISDGRQMGDARISSSAVTLWNRFAPPHPLERRSELRAPLPLPDSFPFPPPLPSSSLLFPPLPSPSAPRARGGAPSSSRGLFAPPARFRVACAPGCSHRVASATRPFASRACHAAGARMTGGGSQKNKVRKSAARVLPLRRTSVLRGPQEPHLLAPPPRMHGGARRGESSHRGGRRGRAGIDASFRSSNEAICRCSGA